MRKDVKVKNNCGILENKYPIHRLEFDSVYYDVIGNEVTLRETEIFKEAILAERDRIWNEAYGKINTDIINKILKCNKERVIIDEDYKLCEYLRGIKGLKIQIKKGIIEGKEVYILDIYK